MDGIKLLTRNCLTGTVNKVNKGVVNSEVLIEMPSGQMITAIITNESCSNLNLKKGSKAIAIFKASQVILGIKA